MEALRDHTAKRLPKGKQRYGVEQTDARIRSTELVFATRLFCDIHRYAHKRDGGAGEVEPGGGAGIRILIEGCCEGSGFECGVFLACLW